MNLKSKPAIDLIVFGAGGSVSWNLGRIWHSEASVHAVAEVVKQVAAHTQSDACLFWDPELGAPSEEAVVSAFSLPGDVWHAGLRLGLGGLPGLINFVHPTWMLNRDPDPTRVATSWRMSLRAALVRVSVLRRLGGVSTDFESLIGASLEMGHRYIRSGAIMRHVPSFVHVEAKTTSEMLPFSDEWRFVFHHWGHKWIYWALTRALLTGYASSRSVWKALLDSRRTTKPQPPPAYYEKLSDVTIDRGSRVTVLIPTFDRYDYLKRLLPQLRSQTVKPSEIIIVDQTPISRRINTLVNDWPDLPLRIYYQEYPGQCSARNFGLSVATGEYILFLDDDDEIPPDLIEAHLRSLKYFQAPISCGVAEETGPIRCSDIFPSNNALIHRDAMEDSGLFDVAYDRDWSDDADFGTRMYLSGCLMILNPNIRVLHHHASQGGLRSHGSHVITFAMSRISLFQRQLPSPAEIYMYKRHFTALQTRERLLICLFGTLAFHGHSFGKTVKSLLGTVLFPITLWQIRKNIQKANLLLRSFPQIPSLSKPLTAEVS